MKKTMKNIVAGLFAVSMITSTSLTAIAAPLNVYAEGAYELDNAAIPYLVVEVYADIAGDAVLSGGVKLTYDPAKVTNPQLDLNDADWYMGEGTNDYPYRVGKGTETPGEVVIIIGKIDTRPGEETTGNSGKTLLATVTFDQVGTSTVSDSDFGLSLGVDRAHPGNPTDEYVNFASNNPADLDRDDDVNFTDITVVERGDANMDGVITNSDFFAAKAMITGNDYKVYADCNNDGVITNSDFFCIKGKI